MKNISLLLILSLLVLAKTQDSPCTVTNLFQQSGIPDSDFNGWQFPGYGGDNPTSECSGTKMMGGMGHFGKGVSGKYVQTELPVHTHLKISFKFYAVNSWDDETFTASLDGYDFYSQMANQANSNVGNQCGGNWPDNFYDYEGTIEHSGKFMAIEMRSNLDEDANNESWAISDLVIEALNNDQCEAPVAQVEDCESIDLFTQGAFTDADFAAWDFSGSDPQPRGDCSGTQMAGGLGKLGRDSHATLVFTGTPEHQRLRLSWVMYFVASWDNESMFMYVNDELVWQQAANQANSNWGNQCGSAWPDNKAEVEIDWIAHSDEEVRIRFECNLNEDHNNEAFGFSDFRIDYLNDQSNCPRDLERHFDEFKVQVDSPESQPCNVHSSLKYTGFPDSDFNGWAFIGADLTNPKYTCGEFNMLGGLGNTGKDVTSKFVLSDLPAHTELRIRFKAYAVSSWDDETWYLYVDDDLQWFSAFNQGNSNVGNICGTTWPDNFVDVDITIPHVGQFVSLNMWTTLNEDSNNEAYGISDLVIDALTNNECVQPDAFSTECTAMEQWIQDQDDFTGDFPHADYAAWNFYTQGSYPDNQCGDTWMVGGLNQWGSGSVAESVWTGMRPHAKINIKLTWYAVASWDSEVFKLFVDDENVYEKQHVFTDSNWGNQCGSAWQDSKFDLDLTIDHSASQAKLRMETTLDQAANDEAWGFSDLRISYLDANSECARPQGRVETVMDDSGSQQCDDVTFYSECDYKGEQLVIVDEESCLEWSPKSICIPRGKQVTVNDMCEFAGQDATFSQNVSCVGDVDFTFLSKSGITLKGKSGNKNLKSHKKNKKSKNGSKTGCKNLTTLFLKK